MRSRDLLRTFAPSLAGLALAMAGVTEVGCSGAGTVSPTAIEADTQIATVQSALSTPTDQVSSTTAKSLMTHVRSYQRMLPAFSALLALETPQANACMSGSPAGGTYDLGCLTHLQIMGQVVFQASGSTVDGAFQGRLTGNLENVCSGEACANGSAVIDYAPSASGSGSVATLAVSSTIAWQGEVDDFSFGVQGDVGGQLQSKVAYIDANDRSLVVDGADSASPGPYAVSGADHGTFQCMFGTDSGQCSGPTTFSF
jgi:hypothetical protein